MKILKIQFLVLLFVCSSAGATGTDTSSSDTEAGIAYNSFCDAATAYDVDYDLLDRTNPDTTPESADTATGTSEAH